MNDNFSCYVLAIVKKLAIAVVEQDAENDIALA